MSKMDRKHIHLEKRQHKWLKQAATARGVPQAEIIREAIDLYIASQTARAVRAKQKRAGPANAKSTSARRPSHQAPKPPTSATPRADTPSKWRGDDPNEERLRQIERLTAGG